MLIHNCVALSFFAAERSAIAYFRSRLYNE